MAGRVEELLSAVTGHAQGGGQLALVTLTMRHRRGQRLGELWDALAQAWRAATSSGSVRAALSNAVGWVRSVEATHGENGWHLHVHALVFLPAEAGPRAAEAMGRAMFSAWSARLARADLDAPLQDRGGLDVRLLALGQARDRVASYLAKSTYESVTFEVAGAARKRSRKGNRTPFGILADVVRYGEADDVGLWHEWEAASRGRRQVTWSQGLRDELHQEQERSDDELAAETDRGGVEVARLSAGQLRELVDEGRLAQLLEVVENSDVEDAYDRMARWLARMGLALPLRPAPGAAEP
jgi:hypothetical protein